jgi:dTDP-L-rhamnose 4-epimerase
VAHILLTGGAGFIGSHTADELLRRGHRVRVLDCLDPQIHGPDADFPAYLDPRVECVRGDVRRRDDLAGALDGIDAVYHLAAQTGVGQSMYELQSYADVNCTGTAALLQALVERKRPLVRLVLSSSRAVYGEGSRRCEACGEIHPDARGRVEMEGGNFEIACPACGGPTASVATAEDRPLKPLSVYAWTKRQQEELCQYAARTFGLPVTILRYFNVYGSRQSLRNPYTGVVSIFYARILAGEPLSLYEHGKPERDFVHVTDVARANALALEAPVEPGTCINVGSGQVATIPAVARALAQACGREARFEDRGEFRAGDILSCYADLDRSARLLGYRPQVDLAAGMAEFAAWARGQQAVDLYERTVEELERHGLFGRARRP